jgi:hypothetical protein
VDLAGDETDEIDRMAAWCVEMASASPAARLLVVAAGGPERREAIASRLAAALAPRSRLTGEIDPDLVAIEGGLPLTRYALAGHALASLAWLIESLEFEDFSAWLLSPHGPLVPEAAARLDLWWRRRAPLEGDARSSLAKLGQATKEGLESAGLLAAKTLAALSAIDGGPAKARVWSERFRAALDALRPGGQFVPTSLEQQAQARFTDLLDEFGALSRVAGLLDARQALRALRELAARTSWQAATGDARVTICSTHDAPIARYDGVWVAGLSAETWPAPLFTDAFIPLPALRAARVAVVDTAGQLAAAQASLAAWRAAADSLVLGAATASGDMQLAPSPLLAAFPRRDLASRAGWLPWHPPRDAALERIEDVAGDTWPASELLPGGTRSIELQATCPFRAYAELRLGAVELDAPAPGIDHFERGRWLHRALEMFWNETRDSERLAALSAAGLD